MKIDAKTPPYTSLESEIEQLKKQLFLFALRVEQLDNTNQLLQATNQGLVTSNLQLEVSLRSFASIQIERQRVKLRSNF